MFTVESDVPIPEPVAKPQSAKKEPMYPFKKMKVGDSFFAGPDIASKVWTYARVFKNRYGAAFIMRPEGQGIRIWKISDPF